MHIQITNNTHTHTRLILIVLLLYQGLYYSSMILVNRRVVLSGRFRVQNSRERLERWYYRLYIVPSCSLVVARLSRKHFIKHDGQWLTIGWQEVPTTCMETCTGSARPGRRINPANGRSKITQTTQYIYYCIYGAYYK